MNCFQTGNRAARLFASSFVLCLWLVVGAGSALAQTFWQVGTGNWNTAGNWTLGVPNSSSGTTFDAVIANNVGAGAQLFTSGASVRRLRVGRPEGPGQLLISGGGLTVTENLHVNEGGAGLGVVTVENSGSVTAPSTVVGYSSNGPSFFQISGAGTTYNATAGFTVGRLGIGSLLLSASGQLRIGNGMLPLQIATFAGSSGAAYLGNGGVAGSLVASAVQFGLGDGLLGFNHTDDITLAIPISGPGRLDKTGPGKTTLSATNSYTGQPLYDAGTSISRGTLEVTGSISHPAANLHVGTFPPGQQATLAIRGAGTVRNAVGRVGHALSSNGIVSVDGAGSTWTNDFQVMVGYQGAGALAITNGGSVNNQVGYVGYLAGSTGMVTVDGFGSTWTNSDRLFVGTNGIGSLAVTGGGQVTNVNDATIGYAAGSNGSVTVDGPGSAWTVVDGNGNPAGLYVGTFGTGSLSVTNGGVVNATQAANGVQVVSSGTITGDGIINGEVFNYGVVAPGSSPGTLHINGTYTQGDTGTMRMELASSASYDKLQFNGGWLDGTLDVVLLGDYAPQAGDSFDLLDWSPGGILTNTFATLNLPALGGSLYWDTSQLYTAGILSVGLPGDYNANGAVDAADYVVWRNGAATQFDYDEWRAHFGQTADSGAGASANAAVPEPATFLLLMLAASGWCLRRGRAA